MIRCIPCPAPVRHAAHVIHHYVLRPIGRRVHHAAHYAPRVIVYGCCAAAVGGMGAAVVAPPGGYFPQAPAASYAPAPAVSQGWPEMPSYSGIGASLTPTPVNYPGYLPTYSPRPIRPVPEPSSLALLLLPLVALPILRRTRA